VTDRGERWQRLVELKTGREIALEQERAEEQTLAFSPDGRFLAASAMVWDTASGRRLARAEGQIIAFSPDGQLLLSRRGDVIRSGPWRDEALLPPACRQLPHNLSVEDWRRHVSRDEPPARTCPTLR